MATPLSFSLLFLTFSLLLSSSLASFIPADNYLINCGHSGAVADSDHRLFTGDESVLLSSDHTTSVTESATNLGPIYQSARVFRKPSKYVFKINEKGAHLVRFHFRALNSLKFDVSNAQFHVLADRFVLLNNFNGLRLRESGIESEIKEYVLWIDSDELEIEFIPARVSKFAFVNAIEVISAPKDLILDIAQFVDSNGVTRIEGLSKNAFETVARVNVGGVKVTPFNDSLWRTWIPDDKFVRSIDGSSDGSNEVYFSGRISYQIGGESREIAPDNVYNSARVIRAKSGEIAKYNLTWEFRAVEGFKYMVRTHFCDIASIGLGLLYFNVYVNGNLAIENLDLSTIAGLASPYYADLVVDVGHSGVLSVTIKPSNQSDPSGVDAILNGVEVFKLNNSMGSLDGEASVKIISKSLERGSFGVLVPLIAAMGLLVALSMILHKRLFARHESLAWTPLPRDISDMKLVNKKFVMLGSP